MKTLESIIEQLTDEELKQAFLEIVECRTDGVLPPGIVRKVHQEFTDQGISFYIHGMELHILFEIAKRHYNGQ